MKNRKQNIFECSAVTKGLEIELTNYCGMSCLVCPRDKLKHYGFLTFDNFKKIVELLDEGNYSEVIFCGLGDAFIHPEINDFIEYLFLKIPKIKLFFMTKGLALNEKHLQKIKDLKNRGFNVTLTFSVFSFNKKIFNYLTGGDFYDIFLNKLNLSQKIGINYALEFMLSTLTLGELNTFKKIAGELDKDYGISLVHNWGGEIAKKIHDKLFDKNILDKFYIKRQKDEYCEVMIYNYLYINCHGDVFQCSLNEINREGFLGKLGEYNLTKFLDKKKSLNYKKLCSDCFYFNYKTFN